MTFEEQKQRILQGKMYNDLTPELVEARRTAIELTNEYNASYGQAPEIREPILKKLLKNVGEHAFLSLASAVNLDLIYRWERISMPTLTAFCWTRVPLK